jgi:hypothetical protein
METNEVLSLENIARGAANEIFSHLMEQVAKNIADPNTEPEADRSFTIQFVFAPFADRTGAIVDIKSQSKLVSVKNVRTQVFLVEKGNRIVAYPEDPRQTRLFHEKPTSAKEQ